MRKSLLIIACAGLILAGCKRDEERRKIINPLPVNASVVVNPASAVQQYHLLQRDSVGLVVSIVKRLAFSTYGYDELTRVGGAAPYQYQFTRTNVKYGNATWTLTFKDGSNNQIDPIDNNASSTTIKSVDIAVNGTSGQYSYNNTLTITLETAGFLDSVYRLTGVLTLAGVGSVPDVVSFTPTSTGLVCNSFGLIGGSLDISGTGPGGSATSGGLAYETSHEANGTLNWEGNQAGLHMREDGQILLVTSDSRILID